MTEELSKAFDRRRLRSVRMDAKKSASKRNVGEDPSAIAVATVASSGIEASLPETNTDRKGSKLKGSSEHSQKKSKKKKKSMSMGGSEDNLDTSRSPGKKSKKKKKSDAVGESLKATTTKVPSMFASSVSPTKTKKKKSSSIHKDSSASSKKGKSKSKTKNKEDEEGSTSPNDPPVALSSFKSSRPISNSKSTEKGSLRDVKLAITVDNSKRETKLNRSKLGSLTFGDSSIDDDDTPFWKRSNHGTRRNSPIASLEEDDTIESDDEDYLKLKKYPYPKSKSKAVSPPPLSDEDDGYSSSPQESASSDEEPEWLRKRKVFEGKRDSSTSIAYIPPLKKPEPKTDTEKENKDGDDDKEPANSNVPAWANARKTLKKTASTRNTVASAKTETTQNEAEPKEESEDAGKGALPAWAHKRQASLRKMENTRSIAAPAKVESVKKESDENADSEETAGLPSWAQKRQASLRKVVAARDKTAPVKTATRSNNNEEIEKEPEKKKHERGGENPGLPAWANARKSLKKSESSRITTAPIPPEVVNDDKNNDETANESDNKPTWKNKKSGGSTKSTTPVDPQPPAAPNTETWDGQPTWAKAKSELKSSSARPVTAITPEENMTDLMSNNDPKKIAQMAKNFQSSGVPSWAKKKSSESEKASDMLVQIKGEDGSVVDDKSEVKIEENAPKSVKNRTVLWGNKQSEPSKAQSERNFAASTASTADVEVDIPNSTTSKMGKSQSERSMSGSVTSLGSQDNQGSNHSHKNRMVAYLQNTSSHNESSKPTTVQKKASSTPKVSNKSSGKAPTMPSSGNISVKDRTKAWGGSRHNVKDDASSTGTGSVQSIVDPDDADVELLNYENSNSETDSYGRNKAKTWSVKQSPVPAFAGIALKKVKKDDQPLEEAGGQSAPKLDRMYSSKNLKKVTPSPVDTTSKQPEQTVKKTKIESSTNATKDSEEDPDASSFYATKLRKVTTPDASKWKSQKETFNSSSSSRDVPQLRKVGTPNAQKWKEKKAMDKEEEGNPMANLKKVSPPDEKKWQSPKVEDEDLGKLYSSQHERLRKVKPPIGDELKQSEESVDSSNHSAAEFASEGESETQDGDETKDIPGKRLEDENQFNGSVERKSSTIPNTTEESMVAKVVTEDGVSTPNDSVNEQLSTSKDDAGDGELPKEEEENDFDAGELCVQETETEDDLELLAAIPVDESYNYDDGDEEAEAHATDENTGPTPLGDTRSEVKAGKEVEENDLSKEDVNNDVDGGRYSTQDDKSIFKPQKIKEGADDVKNDGPENKDESRESELEAFDVIETDTVREVEGDAASTPLDHSGMNEQTQEDEEGTQRTNVDDASTDDESTDDERTDDESIGDESTNDESPDKSGLDSNDIKEEQNKEEQSTLFCCAADVFSGDEEEESVYEKEYTDDSNIEEGSLTGEGSDDNDGIDAPGQENKSLLDADIENESMTNQASFEDDEDESTDGDESESDEDEDAAVAGSSPSAISPEANLGGVEEENEEMVPVNFGDQSGLEESEVEKSNSELMKTLEDSGVFSDENAKNSTSLASFFDKDQKEDGAKQKAINDGEGDGGNKLENLRGGSNPSDGSINDETNKKPMSVKSLSDHLNASRGTNSYLSETSPVDEESSGGWSDDDSATIKSEFTDITYGTLGSAVVVDATATTSTQEEAAKKLRRMMAAKAAQSQEDIIPGPPPDLPPLGKPKAPKASPSTKASSGGEILFTPPRPLEESDESDSDNDGDNTRKAGKSSKKSKKKKKSKRSMDVERDVDVGTMFEESVPPKKEKKKDKKKKKEKKKIATLEEDIVFDWNEYAGAENVSAAEPSKKKKKKKKRKGESSGDDSP